jgi:vacuolar-type H+-ATPase subunit C/Vma6
MSVGADFNFLCGIFRSRESALVNAQKLDMMMKAPSFPDSVTQMPEGLFGTKLRQNPGIEAIETGYRAELSEITGILKSFSPRQDFTRLIYLPWDFHNLKAAVLHKLDGRGGEELFGPEGEVSAQVLSEMAEAMDFDRLPTHLSRALEQALTAYYEREKDLQCFELALDRQKHLAVLETSRALSAAIHEHCSVVSDLSLSAVFFRAFFAGLPWEKTAWSLTGHPDLLRLKTFYHQKVEDWGGRISSLSSKLLQRLFLSTRSLDDALDAVEREKKTHLRAMNDWGYKPPSVEYAYYFLTRKLTELFNLRLILLCSINRIPETDFRGRVNDAFL